MTKKLTAAAVMAALSVGMMILSIVPMTEIVTPALAGALLTVIMIECGNRLAYAAFATVALLSFFVVPNRDAVVFFVCILGWYPIIKHLLERKLPKIAQYIIKILLFYAGIAAIAGLMFFVYDSQWVKGIALPFAIITIIAVGPIFIIYDMALTQVVMYYRKVIRPKIFR
jgi:hypothetical protein